MITILIPTLNRSEFLLRQLNFLNINKFNGVVFIGDSSNELHKNNLLDGIKNLKACFSIEYFYYPCMSDAEVMKDMFQKIKTPYSAMIGDDDLLLPSALLKCVAFLENNLDYIAAHGKSFKLRLEADNCYGKIIEFGKYTQPILEDINILDRVYSLFTDYSTPLFCVHRSEIWSKIYATIDDYKDPRFHRELAPSLFAPLYGKYKELDNIYMIRQYHSSQYVLKRIEDWVLEEYFFIDFDVFKKELSDRIENIDSTIVPTETRNKMNKAMGIYLESHEKNEIIFLCIKQIIYKYFRSGKEFLRYLRNKLFNHNYDVKLLKILKENNEFNKVKFFLEDTI